MATSFSSESMEPEKQGTTSLTYLKNKTDNQNSMSSETILQE